MKNGAFVRIIDGPYKDRYGKVLSIDGDMGRVTVKWALGAHGKEPTEINEIFTEVVSKKEFDEKGKDISRKAREAYDKEQQQKVDSKKKSAKKPKKHSKSRKYEL